jgi:hypothetical protein
MLVFTTTPRLVLGTLLFLSPTAWAQQALPLNSLTPPAASDTAMPGNPPAVAVAPDVIGDAYLVENVPVDVTAASAAAARDKAIFDGQRTALGQLLTRLGADQGIDANKVPDNKLTGLVQDFEIKQEKASTVRYIATLNVRFKPGAVQNFLTTSGVNYATTASKPVVILPVSTSNGRAVLWEERTAWRAACEALVHPDPILPFLVPAGDLNDVSAVSAHDALAGNDKAMNIVATNYSAGTVVVAQIAADAQQLNPSRPLAVSVTRYDETGLRLSSDLLNIPPAPTIDVQIASAALAVDKTIRQYWRQSSGLGSGTANDPAAIPAGPQSSMPVEAPIANLTELATLKQRLGVVGAIHGVEVASLTRGLANLRINYSGDVVQLQQAIASQNLALVQLPGGGWQLRNR